ncbi:MAG: FAD:protein FMN transferase [Melioribacteraceae bacterium]
MSKVYHNAFYAMGTRMNVVLPHSDEELCERIYKMIKHEVERIETKLSYFLPHSLVSEINNRAYEADVKVDSEMWQILKICLDYNRLTFGAFDITMRKLVDFYKLNSDLDETDLTSCMKNIQLNDELQSIRFLDDSTKIDLGGFGKGYALEKVQKLIHDSPLENAFISFGESSILTKGKHPSGKAWQVGVNNYNNSGGTAYTFELVDDSISTSSNYFLDDSGQLTFKANVINPITGKLKKEIETVTVKSKSPIEAEIFSTAFMNLSKEQICAIKEKYIDVGVVRINFDNEELSLTHL